MENQAHTPDRENCGADGGGEGRDPRERGLVTTRDTEGGMGAAELKVESDLARGGPGGVEFAYLRVGARERRLFFLSG